MLPGIIIARQIAEKLTFLTVSPHLAKSADQ
jgi:hypothetical protein